MALRAVVIPAFIIISHFLGVTETTFLLLLISKLPHFSLYFDNNSIFLLQDTKL